MKIEIVHGDVKVFVMGQWFSIDNMDPNEEYDMDILERVHSSLTRASELIASMKEQQ